MLPKSGYFYRPLMGNLPKIQGSIELTSAGQQVLLEAPGENKRITIYRVFIMLEKIQQDVMVYARNGIDGDIFLRVRGSETNPFDFNFGTIGITLSENTPLVIELDKPGVSSYSVIATAIGVIEHC